MVYRNRKSWSPAPSQPTAEELQGAAIKTVFLPANVTSLYQPMDDQGVIENMKRGFRCRFLSYLLSSCGIDDYMTAVKKSNSLDIIMWASKA